ncbi:YolD-like family protein [Cohnella herbarum]|uniref:YolD-like family protein n=1 Tax=Cohnella herbarum TaxID=2728023 RepID=A0A7Z2VP29_9BACL|nr:YolD-like family protein [Cohnella herbarum]QJD86563.1 YolD-like family protein [Cohnella herbarum]
MSKKLEDSGLWESSRMMLTEYKERMIAENSDFKLKRSMKPVLDEQQWEEIMRVLMESLGMRVVAHFKLYHEYEDCAAIGIVDKVDPYTRTFLIDGERFKMEDIIGAKL